MPQVVTFVPTTVGHAAERPVSRPQRVQRKTRLLPVVLLAVAVALIAGLLSPALGQAHPRGPSSNCSADTLVEWGHACFQPYGDDHWVKDRDPNGWSARVQIQTNYPEPGRKTGKKTRWCANKHGTGRWHECKFDHRESGCVRWRMFEQQGGDGGPTRSWTDWTPWIAIKGRSASRC